MTTPPRYINWISLADKFKGLLRSGLTPAKAAELLERQWYANHFHEEPNLPSDCIWGTDEFGNFTLKLPSGRPVDPAKIMTREPGILDPIPIPFSQIAALKSNASLLEAAMIVSPQAERQESAISQPPTVKDHALAQLVDKLKRDQARNKMKTVDHYRRILMRAYNKKGLTWRVCEAIWREAKIAPGIRPIKKGRPPVKKN